MCLPCAVGRTGEGKVFMFDLAVLPHLDVVQILCDLLRLMDDRYDLLKLADVRNIVEYDAKWVDGQLSSADGHGYMPYVVVIIDEFADLLMIAGDRFEERVIRLAQLARAVGIHLIISTQRPTKSVITGGIKANFQCCAAFRMQRKADSSRVIDSPKAFSLSRPGEMLFYRYPDLVQVQCSMIEDDEIEFGINALL